MSDIGKIDLNNEITLLEASAGTGKTYSIQSLYLRLIVEGAGLPVQNILVVTFTEAATAELRDRLRKVLVNAAAVLADGKAKDCGREKEIIDKAVEGLGSDDGKSRRADLALRVRRALLDFDEAAIYTIHGFCSRVLKKYALETGHPADAEIASSGSSLIEEECRKWIRKNTYNAAPAVVKLLKEAGINAGSLADAAAKCISKHGAVLKPDVTGSCSGPIAGYLQELIKKKEREWRSDISKFVQAEARICATHERNAAAERLMVEFAKLTGTKIAPEEILLQAKQLTGTADAKNAEWVGKTPEWTAADVGLAGLVQSCKGLLSVFEEGKPAGYSWADGKLRHVNIEASRLDAAADKVIAEWNKCHKRLSILFAGDEKYPARSNSTIRSLVAGLNDRIDSLKAFHDEFSKLKKAITALSEFDGKIPAGRRLDLSGIPGQQDTGKISKELHLLKNYAVKAVVAGFEASEERGSLISFDDLLLNLKNALVSGNAGLLNGLRSDYKVALIDEFQDTDPVQYEIFRRIFRDDACKLPVILVGDPKQAIYRFRNGDIFTYCGAAGQADKKIPLDTNHRSEKNLVDAVNGIFKDKDAKGTFLSEEPNKIKYAEDLKAKGKEPEDVLTEDGKVQETPFKLVDFGNPGGSGVPGQGSAYAQGIYEWVAAEVCRLIDRSGKFKIGKRNVEPSDIAILVATHKQARYLEQALKARNVPVVRQNSGSVLATSEAQDAALVIQAMAEPGSQAKIRAVIASGLFGYDQARLAAFAADGEIDNPCPDTSSGEPGRDDGGEEAEEALQDTVTGDRDGRKKNTYKTKLRMEDWVEMFKSYHDTWKRSSFIAAYTKFVRSTGLRGHILSLPDGERRLTNFLQQGELIYSRIKERKYNIDSAAAWFCTAVARGGEDDDTAEESDENSLRLETDDSAVKILTIFKSKGLQYPIVFVPTIWHKQAGGHGAGQPLFIEYHDKDGNLVLDSDLKSEEAKKALSESLQECVRIFYVAATRAVNRTYLVRGEFGKPGEIPEDSIISRMFPGSFKDLQDLALPNVEVLQVTTDTLKKYESLKYDHVSASLDIKLCCPDRPRFDLGHGHTSFSQLAKHASEQADKGDSRDYDETTGAAAGPEPEPEGDGKDKNKHGWFNIFDYPAGAKTGECWHKMFEVMDFTAPEKDRETVVREQIDLFRMHNPADPKAEEKTAAVLRMVNRVLDTELNDGKQTVQLGKVGMPDRLSELGFDFALSSRDCKSGDIIRILEKHLGLEGDRFKGYIESLKGWNMKIPKGFMTGFIDLVFRVGQRYYIVDWKSNRRHGKPLDFDDAGMMDEMTRHNYILQYLLYVTAMHKYLSQRLGDKYDYEKHFGSVYYLFLRAVDGNGAGVFRHRPAKAFIEDLAKCLGR